MWDKCSKQVASPEQTSTIQATPSMVKAYSSEATHFKHLHYTYH